MERLFDTFLFADWSAASQPTRQEPCRDAIWTAELEVGTAMPTITYLRTRQEAAAHLRDRLARHVDNGKRVLIGCDFPYGYPQGTARALGLCGKKPWLAMWDLLDEAIEDSERNVNNRWQAASWLNERISAKVPGPFWGCPAARQTATLSSRKNGLLSFPYPTASGELSNRRLTESRLPGTQEVWKLLGAGSVGSQALVGIPRVYALRSAPELAEHSLVWPFETDFDLAAQGSRRPLIVHAEIWPGLVEPAVRAHQAGRIRDLVQVEQLCLWAARVDAAGRLGKALQRPRGLSDEEIVRCVDEEGWVLGAE